MPPDKKTMNNGYSSDTLRKKHQERKRRCRISSYRFKIWSMVAVCVFLVIAASALLYFLLMKKGPKQEALRHTLLPKGTEFVAECFSEYVKLSERFDCYPEDPNVNRYLCEARGCCFLGASGDPSVPNCVYPKNYGYKLKGNPISKENGFELPLQRLPAPSRYGDDIHAVNVLVEKQTPYRLRIKFYDSVSERYEVPMPKVLGMVGSTKHKKLDEEPFLYTVTYNASKIPFALRVLRQGQQMSKTILFDTSAGALTLSHHFLELSTFLPSQQIYGISGHISKEFTNELSGKTWSLFADPTLKGGGGGIHPMYVCIEDDGKAHGVLLLNSNALELKLLPTPAITFRTIGGVLDFYIFLGPTPEDVIRQYTEAVGRPMLLPYWSLGLHTGGKIMPLINETRAFLHHWEGKDIPLEVVHLDYDVSDMHYSGKFGDLYNFTIELQQREQKIMIYVRPSMRFDESLNSMYKIGLKQSAFITDKWGLSLYGKVAGQDAVYVDFGTASFNWWTDVLQKLYATYVHFDGILLADNEPYSEVDGSITGCMNDDLNRPPYVPCRQGKTLYAQTLCMDAIQHWEDKEYAHYYLHNLYGHLMASSTQKVVTLLPDKHRKLLMSQSTFSGTGHYAGHWMEEAADSWDTFEESIEKIVSYNLHGIPSVGAKICASSCLKRSEELVLQWIQLSVFYPLSGIFDCRSEERCSAEVWSREFYRSVRQSALLRYKFLPYLYTLFYKAHAQGSTVMTYLMHEFPEDNNTYSIKSQFMWGPALLISPLVKKDAKQIKYYLPRGIWYKFPMGDMIISNNEWFNETVVDYDYHNPAVLYIRSGHILVLQEPSRTTTESRLNPMKLLIALNASLEAEGTLFWDDGTTRDSIIIGEYMLVKFTVANNTLTVSAEAGSKVLRHNFNTAYIQHLTLMGLDANPKVITINENYIVSSKKRTWNQATKVLDIKKILIRLEGTTQIKW